MEKRNNAVVRYSANTRFHEEIRAENSRGSGVGSLAGSGYWAASGAPWDSVGEAELVPIRGSQEEEEPQRCLVLLDWRVAEVLREPLHESQVLAIGAPVRRSSSSRIISRLADRKVCSTIRTAQLLSFSTLARSLSLRSCVLICQSTDPVPQLSHRV